MPESLGHRAASGAIWASIDRFGSMGLQFVVNLILARILTPADFGMIGMLAIFIAVSQTLIDSGFASALIQKKNPTQTDYSTIFFWNIVFSSILYLILYIVAPYIAHFYLMPMLSEVLRVIALNLIITGVLAIQKTRLQKTLAFKTICVVNISSYVCGASLGIYMAHHSCGVWSLVWMQIIYSLISVLLLSVITRWKPSITISIESLKELFGFGGFIMAANILQTVCQNLQGLIIGKKFSASQMGYFSQAYKLDQITSYSIPQVIVQVMFPVFSSIQDNRDRLNNLVLLTLRVIAFIVFPILSVLIIVAETLIHDLYGEIWVACTPYFRILCIGGYFVCLQNITFYAVAAIGKSRSLFIWSFYKWGFLLTALVVGMCFGMYGILWGMVASSLNIYLTNAILAQKHNHLPIINQLSAVIPYLLLSGFGGVVIMIIKAQIKCNAILCILYLIIYLVISYLLKLKGLFETLQIIKNLSKNDTKDNH